jgi:hypothetical protein
MRTKWTLLLGAFALGACDITNPPDWTAEYVFPLDFPAVDLSGIPGGTIPIDSVSFTTPVVSQDTDGLVDRILQSEDLAALRAELILSTTLDVTGSLELSIAASPGNLFSPTQSLTTTVSIRQGTDTSSVPVILEVFHGAETLFFQSNVVVAGSGGSITVPPGAQIRMGVNFIGTVRVSK